MFILAGMIPRWIKVWFTSASPRVTARLEDEAPRGQWARVVVGSTLVVVLGVSVVAWIWWDRLAERRYAEVMQDYRAAGVALVPADVVRETIDPADNAAVLLLEASKRIR